MMPTRGILAFEFQKATSMVRNHVIIALAAVVSIVPLIFGAMYYRDTVLGSGPVPLSEFDAVGFSNSQLTIGAIFIAIFGIMITSFDMKGGAQRGVLLAVPRRAKYYVAKLAIGALISGLFGLIVVPVCFVVSQSILGRTHGVGLGDDGVIRSLIGAVLYLMLITVFAIGLTSSLRSAAIAVGLLLPLMFIVSTILSSIPVDWISTTAQFLPDIAGARMMRVYVPADSVLGPYTGGLVLAVWAAVAVTVGWLRLDRRDVTD